MATPEHIRVGCLRNEWILQGVSWIIRKTVPAITITTAVSEYSKIDPESNESVPTVELTQRFSGGFASTIERRTLNWRPQDYSDYIFGSAQLQARYIRGHVITPEEDQPEIELEPEMQHKEEIRNFLSGTALDKGNASAFLVGSLPENSGVINTQGVLGVPGLWIYTVERKLETGGLSSQVSKL
ncbi:hypothetical protein N7532_006865 [Penicillium argentinense]|uniref:Uncharacterized protein n=1 Tax=Penicillium argentinense TaxID=1131581 RepID=A0A9W9FGT1_9EURO|nr:uncharacterized protein N7532_006865 [Penicillium argentinense]KAJ5099864.1 hypothetical protein N7532_006865 [Penicillium argentinense]